MTQTFIRYLREHPSIRFLGIAVLTISAMLLTLAPSEYLASNFIWSYDKLGHILLFGFWTFLYGLHRYIENPEFPNFRAVFFTGLLFGAVIELLQYLLPINRGAELLDLGCDAAGALAAVLLLRFLFSPSSPE